MSTSKGRGAAAHTIGEVVPPGAAPVPVRPPAAGDRASTSIPRAPTPIPRLFDEFDRLGAATAGREVKGELPVRATSRSSATRCWTRRRMSRRRPPPSAPRSPTSRCWSRSRASTCVARVAAEKGAPLTGRRGGRAGASVWPPSVAGWRPTPPTAPGSRSGATPDAARRPSSCDPMPARRSSRALRGRRGRRADAPAVRRAVADGDLRRRRGAAASRPRPRSTPSTSRSSAAPTVRARAGCWRASSATSSSAGSREAGTGTPGEATGMSVGVQRLREEPDRIRQGAIDKREDPALVDRALEVDARRRRLQAEVGRAQGRAERRQQAGRRGDPRRREARRPRGRRPPRGVHAGRRPDRRDRRGAGGDRGGARGPAPADPEPRRPRRPGRRRGGQRHGPHLGRARRARGGAAPDGATWARRPHWEIGEALDIIDNAARRQDRGLRVPGLQGRRARGSSGPDQLVPRRAHARARLHRGLAAGRGQRRIRAGHRARSRTRKTRCTSSPATTCTWSPPPRSRSPTSTATRSSRPTSCRSATPPTRPASGARPGAAGKDTRGHPARPPVRQGRDGALREARRQPRPRSSG